MKLLVLKFKVMKAVNQNPKNPLKDDLLETFCLESRNSSHRSLHTQQKSSHIRDLSNQSKESRGRKAPMRELHTKVLSSSSRETVSRDHQRSKSITGGLKSKSVLCNYGLNDPSPGLEDYNLNLNRKQQPPGKQTLTKEKEAEIRQMFQSPNDSRGNNEYYKVSELSKTTCIQNTDSLNSQQTKVRQQIINRESKGNKENKHQVQRQSISKQGNGINQSNSFQSSWVESSGQIGGNNLSFNTNAIEQFFNQQQSNKSNSIVQDNPVKIPNKISLRQKENKADSRVTEIESFHNSKSQDTTQNKSKILQRQKQDMRDIRVQDIDETEPKLKIQSMTQKVAEIARQQMKQELLMGKPQTHKHNLSQHQNPVAKHFDHIPKHQKSQSKPDKENLRQDSVHQDNSRQRKDNSLPETVLKYLLNNKIENSELKQRFDAVQMASAKLKTKLRGKLQDLEMSQDPRNQSQITPLGMTSLLNYGDHTKSGKNLSTQRSKQSSQQSLCGPTSMDFKAALKVFNKMAKNQLIQKGKQPTLRAGAKIELDSQRQNSQGKIPLQYSQHPQREQQRQRKQSPTKLKFKESTSGSKQNTNQKSVIMHEQSQNSEQSVIKAAADCCQHQRPKSSMIGGSTGISGQTMAHSGCQHSRQKSAKDALAYFNDFVKECQLEQQDTQIFKQVKAPDSEMMVKINNKLVKLQDLIRICTDHSRECNGFERKVDSIALQKTQDKRVHVKNSKSHNVNEPTKRLATLKEIRSRIIGKSDSIMVGNLKKLILALKTSLTRIDDINQREIEFVQEETLKVLEQLIYKNDPDLEIHFSLIMPDLVKLLETSNTSLKEQLIKCVQLYCEFTSNVEAVLTATLRYGVESENPHLRHQAIKALPLFIGYGSSKQIEHTVQFKKAIEALLIRARGDSLDSIRVQAQESLRLLISEFSQRMPEIMMRLNPQQRQQLADLMAQEEEINKQQNDQLQLTKRQFDPVPQAASIHAFGCLPLTVIQHIQQHSDWMVKLKMTEELERVLNEFGPKEKATFMNYASSFITFVEQYLIQEDNMKIVLAGIRILSNDSEHMRTKSLVLNLLHLFKTYRISNDAKESLLRSVLMVLLTQDGSQINDLQSFTSFKEDNLYMQLVEPLAYLYTAKQEPLRIRYLAQECLAVMASRLNKQQLLEALYECLADDKKLYDKFCDRLYAEMFPYLSQSNGIVKLEFPLPTSHIYSIQDEKMKPPPLQMRQSKPPMSIQEAHYTPADAYYSQDFNERPNDADFNAYNQVKRQDRGVSQSNNARDSYDINPLDQQDIQINRRQDSQIQPRKKVFGSLGQDIISGGVGTSQKFKRPPINQSLGNDGIEIYMPKQRQNLQTAESQDLSQRDLAMATPEMISQKLRLLKQRDRFSSSPTQGNPKFNQLNQSSMTAKDQLQESKRFQDQNQMSTLDNTSQSSYQPDQVKQNLHQRGVSNSKPTKDNRVSSPPFFSAQLQADQIFLNDTSPQLYSNKYNPHPIQNTSPKQGYRNKPHYYDKFMGGSNNFQGHSFKTQDEANQLEESKKVSKPLSTKKSSSDLSKIKSQLRQSQGQVVDPVEQYQNLESLDNPLNQVQDAIASLNDQLNWEKQMHGCTTLRQAYKHHPELFNTKIIHSMTQGLLKLAESLRSQLSKTALVALQECFQSLRKQMDPEVDGCANIFLKKSADTNQFIAEAAKRTVEALALHCSEGKVISSMIANCDSKSSQIRQQVAKCLDMIIQQLGQKILTSKEAEKILSILATYINDGSPDVRVATRNAILSLESGSLQPLNRVQSEELIKKFVQDQKLQDKMLKILNGETGAELSRSMSGRMSELGSPKKLRTKESSTSLVKRKDSTQQSPQSNVDGMLTQQNLSLSLTPHMLQQSITAQNSLTQQIAMNPIQIQKQVQKVDEAIGSEEPSVQKSNYRKVFKPQVNEEVQADQEVQTTPNRVAPRNTMSQNSRPTSQIQKIIPNQTLQNTQKPPLQASPPINKQPSRQQQQSLNNSMVSQNSQLNGMKKQPSQPLQEQTEQKQPQKDMKEVKPLPQDEVTPLLQLLIKQSTDQRRYALLNLSEFSARKKKDLTSNPLFQHALDHAVITSFLSTTLQKSTLTQNLIEAEILFNLLPEIQNDLPPEQIQGITKATSLYLGSSQAQAKRNAEKLIEKLVQTYPPAQIISPLAQSVINSGSKAKVFIVGKVLEILPQLNKENPDLVSSEVFPIAYRLMDDQAISGRGKAQQSELKIVAESLVKQLYYEQGAGFIEQAPSNKLAKIFDIVNKEKKKQAIKQ